MLNRLLPIVTIMGALFAAGASAASAATGPEASSSSWAGYVATSSDGSSGFSRVSGSWVQPSVDPSAGDGYAAFWVGLGGSGQSESQSLEQIGTQAEISNGQTTYFAWYELVPAAPVQINVPIHAGDHVSAGVSVSGSNVTVALSDQTTGQSYTNTLEMNSPDTSSAEWIAEAPSASDGQGDLQPLPLADFGTANFSSATATADDGHTGSISDGDWTNQAVALGSDSSAGAQASSLSSDGSSFSVQWQGAGSGTNASSGDGSGYPSGGGDPYGYGSGDPSGGGDPYGYGSGDPYGGADPYGYGGDPYGYVDPYGSAGYAYSY